MKVYYRNKITEENVSSLELSGLSSLGNLFHRYLTYPSMFDNISSATINISLPAPVSVSSVLIAYSNTETFTVKLTNSGSVVFSDTMSNTDYINKLTFPPLDFDGGTISLSGSKDGSFIQLGSLYIGDSVTLPRFVVNPTLGEEFLTQSKRSFGGYAYGLDGETLRGLSVEYERIPKNEYLKVLEYLRTVRTTVPHYIDAYEEANDVWPIMYGTLDEGEFDPEKRAENNFYFNFSLSWKEAK
jgi:hypothetical protein